MGGGGGDVDQLQKLKVGSPSCDKTAVAAAHKYGDFTSNKILYNQRGLKHTLIFSLTINTRTCLPKILTASCFMLLFYSTVYDMFTRFTWTSFLFH